MNNLNVILFLKKSKGCILYLNRFGYLYIAYRYHCFIPFNSLLSIRPRNYTITIIIVKGRITTETTECTENSDRW